MDQIKFYRWVIAGLLLLNIFVLAFFLFTQSEPRPNRAPRNIGFQAEVPRILELDSAQQLIFNELANLHSQQTTKLNQEQQELLLPYFESIADSSVALDIDFTLTQFQKLEREKLVVTRQHFLEVKNILEPKQGPLFEILMGNVTDRIVMPRKKRGPRPKDFK